MEGARKASHRRTRAARMVLALVAALAAVFLLANSAFAYLVERRAEESLEAGLGSPTNVDLSGFPVAPRLLTGSLPEADVTVEKVGLPGTGTSLGRLELGLTDVRYEGEREGPLDPPIEARGVRFESRLGEEEVSGLAGALPGVEGAELVPPTAGGGSGGLRLLLVGGATVEAGLAAEEGGLVLEPHTPVLEPEIPLTPGGLPGGASVEEVRVRGGGVVIEGEANGLGV